MFYFVYDHGEFFVIREFSNLEDYDAVDVLPFYDVRKIEDWCEYANLKFPYEFNDYVSNLLSKINLEGDEEYCLSSFVKHVANGDIKLYCEEKK